MKKRNSRIRYNNKLLQEYCNNNKITLLKDYKKETINRNTIINANCLNCNDICSKSFKQFIKTGCFCKFHTLKNARDKMKTTCLKRYGCENPQQNEEVRDKMKTTCLKRYGCEHPQQNAEISEKASKNAYNSYDYKFPSGRIERIQGYESYMLNDLLKEGILEEDIIVNRSKVPKVWYKDKSDKRRRHYVDCFVKSQNRCIETKSTWTAEKKKDCIYLKQQALKDADYKSEIWIYDCKGEIVEKIL